MLFDYTRTRINIIISTVYKLILASKILLYIVPLAWYCYSIYTQATTPGSTMLWFPIVMVCLYIVFGVFDCVITLLNIKNEPTKIVKKIYNIVRIILKALYLGNEIYNLYTIAEGDVNVLKIILTTLSVVLLVVTVLLEILSYVVERVSKSVMDAVNTDIDILTSKFRNIKHLFVEETEEEKKRAMTTEKTIKKLKPKVENLKENYKGLFFQKKKKHIEKKEK